MLLLCKHRVFEVALAVLLLVQLCMGGDVGTYQQSYSVVTYDGTNPPRSMSGSTSGTLQFQNDGTATLEVATSVPTTAPPPTIHYEHRRERPRPHSYPAVITQQPSQAPAAVDIVGYAAQTSPPELGSVSLESGQTLVLPGSTPPATQQTPSVTIVQAPKTTTSEPVHAGLTTVSLTPTAAPSAVYQQNTPAPRIAGSVITVSSVHTPSPATGVLPSTTQNVPASSSVVVVPGPSSTSTTASSSLPQSTSTLQVSAESRPPAASGWKRHRKGRHWRRHVVQVPPAAEQPSIAAVSSATPPSTSTLDISSSAAPTTYPVVTLPPQTYPSGSHPPVYVHHKRRKLYKAAVQPTAAPVTSTEVTKARPGSAVYPPGQTISPASIKVPSVESAGTVDVSLTAAPSPPLETTSPIPEESTSQLTTPASTSSTMHTGAEETSAGAPSSVPFHASTDRWPITREQYEHGPSSKPEATIQPQAAATPSPTTKPIETCPAGGPPPAFPITRRHRRPRCPKTPTRRPSPPSTPPAATVLPTATPQTIPSVIPPAIGEECGTAACPATSPPTTPAAVPPVGESSVPQPGPVPSLPPTAAPSTGSSPIPQPASVPTLPPPPASTSPPAQTSPPAPPSVTPGAPASSPYPTSHPAPPVAPSMSPTPAAPATAVPTPPAPAPSSTPPPAMPHPGPSTAAPGTVPPTGYGSQSSQIVPQSTPTTAPTPAPTIPAATAHPVPATPTPSVPSGTGPPAGYSSHSSQGPPAPAASPAATASPAASAAPASPVAAPVAASPAAPAAAAVAGAVPVPATTTQVAPPINPPLGAATPVNAPVYPVNAAAAYDLAGDLNPFWPFNDPFDFAFAPRYPPSVPAAAAVV